MRPSLVIFDLDGTLADSFPWFLRHVNDVADRFGFRRIADDEINALRRTPSRVILRRLEVPLWKLPAISSHMRKLKAQHVQDIPLFPGTDAMLRALHEAHIRLALVSSDSEANARKQLGEANAALFQHFACGAALFGKAAKFRRIVRLAHADSTLTLAIGDEVRDIEAARKAGFSAPPSVGATPPPMRCAHTSRIICSSAWTRSPGCSGSWPHFRYDGHSLLRHPHGLVLTRHHCQLSIFLCPFRKPRIAMPVTDNTAKSRFELEVEGHIAFAEYTRENDVITFTHTEVPEQLGGKGVGSKLASGALDLVRTKGLRVIARCPFIAGYIARKTEYQDLLKT